MRRPRKIPLGRLSRRSKILAFTAGLCAVGLTGYVLLVLPMASVVSPVHVPWLILAIGFYLAETKVIEVPFRRETHSLSLSEIPAVLGLFFVDPQYYVVALVLGAGIGLITVRQPALKVAFNLSQYLVGAVVALSVFHLLAHDVSIPGPREWVAALAAMTAMSSIGAVAIATAITLSGAAPQYQRLPQMLQVGAVIAIANTSVALLGVDMMWSDPRKLWLLAIPIGTLFIAYRAYLSERKKHESLELLYESSRIFQRSPELDSAIVALLEHARTMFRSDRAELLIFRPEGPPLRTAVGPGDAVEVMGQAEDAIELAAGVQERNAPYLFVPAPEAPGGDRLYPNGMVCPLRGEAGVMGAMVVTNRTGEDEAFADDELRLLETVANQAAMALENTQLEQSLAELSRLKEELRELAFYDPLTGLANRRLFLDQVKADLERDGRDDFTTVVFLDLDDFKLVNDTVGHATGDELLRAVGARIRSQLGPGHLSARLGGDEFAILLRDGPTHSAARDLTLRVLNGLRQPFRLTGREFMVTAGAGIAAATEPDITADQLLRNADVAMYTSKSEGKGSVSVYDPEMHAAAIDRHELRSDLSRAVRRRELEVCYQPIVELDSGKVLGVEALARWNHPLRGPVSPQMFIALAEESGSIVSLGAQVLEEAARDVAEWSRSGQTGPLTVAVNVSQHQVRQGGFVDVVTEALRRADLGPERLVLEMTETAMFADTSETSEVLQRLRNHGVRLGVDDFGTGYSSLGYLHRFPVDVIKIAREFVSGEGGPDDLLLAEAMIALGKALGIKVVAEGVETLAQHARLRELGCDFGQGFLYSPGVDAASLPRAIRDVERVLASPRAGAAAVRVSGPERADWLGELAAG